MASKDKVSEKVQEAIFGQLLSTPANGECADCGNRSPTWVSLDFGVFVCIRCSGVHRQIGPHITRVRSVKLDGWTKENIEIMATVGNGIANDYYEHKMPTGYRKPGANSSPEECRRFVDEKYIRKAFVPSGHREPVKEFVDCRTKGSKPDFTYSQQKSKEVAKPTVNEQQPQQNNVKPLRKKSTNVEKLPQKPAPQQHQQDLLSNDVDLLGSYTESDHRHETHSVSPAPAKKIDFASFKKAQSQPPVPHHPVQQDLTNNAMAWGDFEVAQPAHTANTVSNTTAAQPQPQPQENKVDVMQLYNQPQMHQNRFMQGMPHQGWQVNHGWNNGMQQGFNGNPQWQQNNFHGGFQQQQQQPQNFGMQQGFYGNPNMGYNPYMNGQTAILTQGPMQNAFGNNGFVQNPGHNNFF